MRATSLGKLGYRLSYLQSEASVASPWSDAVAGELRNLERNGWFLEGERGIGAQATLLRAYYTLKGGPDRCKADIALLARLNRVTRSGEPESMAAKWILGRFQLSLAALRDASREHRRLRTSDAYHNFASIEAVDLDHPVLLPGVLQECPPERFVEGYDPLHDPVVMHVSRPYRYMATAAISLSELEPSRSEHLLQMAMVHAAGTSRQHARASAPGLNGSIARDMSASLLELRHGTAAGESAKLIHGTLARTVDMAAGVGLPPRKRHEWLALCHANIALVSKSGEDHTGAVDELLRNLRSLVDAHGGVPPDFVHIDPHYALALSSQGGLASNLRVFSRPLQLRGALRP